MRFKSSTKPEQKAMHMDKQVEQEVNEVIVAIHKEEHGLESSMKGEGGDRLVFAYGFQVAVEDQGHPPKPLGTPVEDDAYRDMDAILRASEKSEPRRHILKLN